MTKGKKNNLINKDGNWTKTLHNIIKKNFVFHKNFKKDLFIAGDKNGYPLKLYVVGVH